MCGPATAAAAFPFAWKWRPLQPSLCAENPAGPPKSAHTLLLILNRISLLICLTLAQRVISICSANASEQDVNLLPCLHAMHDCDGVAYSSGGQKSWQQQPRPRKPPRRSRSCTGKLAPAAAQCWALQCPQDGAPEGSPADPQGECRTHNLLNIYSLRSLVFADKGASSSGP